MKRSLTLVYPDGEPAARRSVRIINGSKILNTQTDAFGKLDFDWDEDWIDVLEVEQIPLKRDWDISGGFLSGSQNELGEFQIPRPDDNRPDDQHQGLFAKDRERGVHGRLFYSDGTSVFRSFRIEVELLGTHIGQRYSTTDRGSYCHENGEFFVATHPYERGTFVSKIYVSTDWTSAEIPRKMYRRGANGDYMVILPQDYGKGGTRGGLITGQVLDNDGLGVPQAKLQAEIRGTGLFNLSDHAETYTDHKGRFQLPFDGGTTIKRLFIDGYEPVKIVRTTKTGSEEQMPVRNIPAGSFNLRILRHKRSFLGLF